VSTPAQHGGKECDATSGAEDCSVPDCPALLKTEQDDKCLDLHHDTANVYMHSCHGRDNQKWYWDGERLKTPHDGKCLDYHKSQWFTSNKDVYGHTCHTGDNQKWYFDGEHLKTRYDNNKCLDAETGEGFNVYGNSCHDAGNQKWYFSS